VVKPEHIGVKRQPFRVSEALPSLPDLATCLFANFSPYQRKLNCGFAPACRVGLSVRLPATRPLDDNRKSSSACSLPPLLALTDCDARGELPESCSHQTLRGRARSCSAGRSRRRLYCVQVGLIVVT